MNTHKEQFGSWKHCSQILVLGDFNAMKFKRSGIFRDRVLEKIQSSRSQLELIFKGPAWDTPISLKGLSAVKKVQIADEYILTEWPTDVAEISLQFCKFSRVSVNVNTRQVSLQKCSFDNTDWDNADSFTNLDSLAIGSYTVLNYHLLSHLKQLKIENCSNITDVGCFRNIPDLTLSRCSQIH
jgi:hypothetical protein